MWGITTFFNPAGYANKLENLRRFRESSKRQGLRLMVVELAFGDAPFEVPADSANIIIRRRTNSVMWQKERLLNIGLSFLPPAETVAWIDADIVFENEDWIAHAERLLQQFKVVQLFDVAALLDPAGEVEQVQNGTAYEKELAQKQVIGGHSGFAWAARAEILRKHGFYDKDIAGSGDFTMACAMWNLWEEWGGLKWRELFFTPEHLADIDRWGKSFYEDVRGNVSYVPGKAFHLWHGRQEDRDYLNRYIGVKNEGYDPATDIRIAENGCWEWASDKPELHRYVKQYFDARKEGQKQKSRTRI
jgi:hypothetical protein